MSVSRANGDRSAERPTRERKKAAAVSFPAGPWLAGRSVGRRQLDIDPPRLPFHFTIPLSGLSPPLLLFWHACLTE